MIGNKVFVGIDVSKGYADFSIITSEQDFLEPSFQLDDEKIGHDFIKEKIKYLLTLFTEVFIGVENTGGYERNWVNALRGMGKKNNRIHVYKLNPKAVRHQLQTLMKTVVDDSVSAFGIAVYMINNHGKYSSNWEKSTSKAENITDEQLVHSMVQALIKQRTAKLNQLEKLLYSAFPELLRFVKNSFPKWVLYLIEKYPSADSVKKAKVAGLAKIRWITDVKAKEIKELAKQSVGSLQSDLVCKIVSQYSRDILSLEEEIDKYKSILVDLYKDNEQAQLLCTAKGVGVWSAAAFLIELGDFSRFASADQIASFYGVHPSFKKSGDGLFKVKMSKQGNSKMRAILYLIAHNMVMHNPYFKSLYAKHKAKGKSHRSVMGILMHKALRMFWGMLKNNTAFDEKIDQKNQEKQPENKSLVHEISPKARRYQPLSLNAPISRSNSKKRKAILTPQSPQKDETNEVIENSQVQT